MGSFLTPKNGQNAKNGPKSRFYPILGRILRILGSKMTHFWTRFFGVLRPSGQNLKMGLRACEKMYLIYGHFWQVPSGVLRPHEGSWKVGLKIVSKNGAKKTRSTFDRVFQDPIFSEIWVSGHVKKCPYIKYIFTSSLRPIFQTRSWGPEDPKKGWFFMKICRFFEKSGHF